MLTKTDNTKLAHICAVYVVTLHYTMTAQSHSCEQKGPSATLSGVNNYEKF